MSSVVRQTTSLTPQRIALLKFIDQHIRIYGVPPSYDDMAAAIDIQPSGSIYHHLNVLEAKGFITRRDRLLELTHPVDWL